MTKPKPETLIALRLLQVLHWPNPDGRIMDSYLPQSLVENAIESIKLVPKSDMLIAVMLNQDTYPMSWSDGELPYPS